MSDVARRGGSHAKASNRRAEILDAAVKVFSESGFHGGTIRSIAERVGISQAGLLYYFATKAELLEAMLTQRDVLAGERVGPGLPTGLALLDALVHLTAYNATTPGLVALYAVLSGEGTAADHPGHGYFSARYARVHGVLEEAIRVGQQRGELRADVDPELAARTLIALSDGLQIQWLYEDGGFDMTGPIRVYVQTLLPGSGR